MYYITQFDPGKEKDPIRLKKLFQVTQAILIYKGMQCEIAEEKMAEMAEQQGKMGARRGKTHTINKRGELQMLSSLWKEISRIYLLFLPPEIGV